uniref:Uncharacterized protein n=1 Tax=Megaselia scalaris TaxID=36166 RepID=T1GDR5_MEGSC
MKKGLGEIFPASEVITSETLTLLTLKCDADELEDSEKNASNFVLAAREITSRLRLHGYWSDFINPFSGKPFYTWTSGKKTAMESRFKGLGIELENVNECTVIKPVPSNVFSACIFTTAPSDEKTLKELLEE